MTSEIDELKAAVAPIADVGAAVKALIHEMAVKLQQKTNLEGLHDYALQLRHGADDLKEAVLEGTQALKEASAEAAPVAPHVSEGEDPQAA